MKRLLPFVIMIAGMVCGNQVKAETFTADDFVGEGKFCTQLFYGTEMVDERVQEGAWGRFERVEGSDNKIRLSSFKNEGAVTFTINGDQLILDGTETKDGAQCGSAKLRTVIMDKGALQKDYFIFKDSPSEYSGTISRDSDGNLNIVFDSKYLVFRKRESDSGATTNYDNFAKDFFNTFKKCELHILSYESTFDAYPIYTKELTDNGETYDLGIRNLFGCGEHFSYNNDGTYNILPQGVEVSVNKASKQLTINRQPYSGKLEPEFKTTYIVRGANIGNYSSVGAYVTNLKTVNYWIESTDGNDTNSNYNIVSRVITPGWHKSHGGDFRITENVSSEASWVNYSYSSDDGRTDISTVSHTILLPIENTPEAVLDVTACEFNDNGIHVSGTITEDNLSDAVESYNVYLISGKHYDISESDEFDGTLPEGHSKAVLVAENLVPENGSVSFDELFSFNTPIDKGWNPYDNGGTMSVYLRYNLKSDTETAADAPLRAPANVYAFGSMVARDRGVATGISTAVADGAVIKATEGMITVTGTSAPVNVYDAAGRTVYSGNAGEIAVGNGLYIVKAGETTTKVIVK